MRVVELTEAELTARRLKIREALDQSVKERVALSAKIRRLRYQYKIQMSLVAGQMEMVHDEE